MTHTLFTLQQNVYNADHEPIPVEDVDKNNVSSPALQRLIDSAQDAAVGVAATYHRRDCTLSSLAFATLTRVLVVHFFAAKKQNLQHQQQKKGQEQHPPVSRGRTLIQDQLLCDPDIQFMDDRRSFEATMNALGGELILQKQNVKALFAHRERDATAKDVALQAWATCRSAAFPDMASRFARIPRISTDTMPDVHLCALAKISRDAEILEALKPMKVVNEVKDGLSISRDGNANLECTHFRTRIMKHKNQVIHIETQDAGRVSTITSHAQKIDGRQASINVKGAVHASGKVLRVTTIGKEGLKAAEAYRESVVLKALQGTITLTHYPFFCSIWAPTPFVYDLSGTLNYSQYEAVERILSQADRDRVLLIQGPPGTGKTTVIAASVDSIVRTGHKDRTVWLVAQSNVAVKNIAEKLDKVGFHEFKLMVSKTSIMTGMHEHLYERLEHCFVRSDMLIGEPDDIEQLLLDAYAGTKTRVILCTLSMLSHPLISAIALQVPVETVIFDEASQIEVGNYLPLLQHNIQNRMPLVIGSFISRHVYNQKLMTEHDITSKAACRFLDVKKGKEEKSGKSWANPQEVSMVIHLARIYHKQGKQFRIITPYDGQRSDMEKQLQSAKLPWKDKCLNVDSFQGNEEDHIIVSLVRTQGVGFLTNMRRMNVMLTRYKMSVIICTNRDFVTNGEAADTLVGQLALTMDPDAWLESRDIVNGILK
ncbi:P-loop containing nucleoside triphosphate hydrolase protein [Suillus americanus]|nr:P-loop containing nucleoside triphosphate hydrolase protein [Suillus americanus]